MSSEDSLRVLDYSIQNVFDKKILEYTLQFLSNDLVKKLSSKYKGADAVDLSTIDSKEKKLAYFKNKLEKMPIFRETLQDIVVTLYIGQGNALKRVRGVSFLTKVLYKFNRASKDRILQFTGNYKIYEEYKNSAKIDSKYNDTIDTAIHYYYSSLVSFMFSDGMKGLEASGKMDLNEKIKTIVNLVLSAVCYPTIHEGTNTLDTLESYSSGSGGQSSSGNNPEVKEKQKASKKLSLADKLLNSSRVLHTIISKDGKFATEAPEQAGGFTSTPLNVEFFNSKSKVKTLDITKALNTLSKAKRFKSIFRLAQNFLTQFTELGKAEERVEVTLGNHVTIGSMRKLGELTKAIPTEFVYPEEVFDNRLIKKRVKVRRYERTVRKKQHIYMLMDTSGSMGGSNLTFAKALVIALSKHGLANGIPIILRFFNTSASGAIMLKDKTEWISYIDKVCSEEVSGCTNTHRAVTIASKDLNTLEDQLLNVGSEPEMYAGAELVVISDGEDSLIKEEVSKLLSSELRAKVRKHLLLLDDSGYPDEETTEEDKKEYYDSITKIGIPRNLDNLKADETKVFIKKLDIT